MRLREVGAKWPLNDTSKLNRQTDTQTNTQTNTHMDISTYRNNRPRGPMLWKGLFSTTTKNWSGKIFLRNPVFITETNFCPSFFQRNTLLSQKNVLVAEKLSPINKSFCQKRKFCHRSKLIESYYTRPSDFPPVEKRC